MDQRPMDRFHDRSVSERHPEKPVDGALVW
jgi:hypothetical protein